MKTIVIYMDSSTEFDTIDHNKILYCIIMILEVFLMVGLESIQGIRKRPTYRF